MEREGERQNERLASFFFFFLLFCSEMFLMPLSPSLFPPLVRLEKAKHPVAGRKVQSFASSMLFFGSFLCVLGSLLKVLL